MSRRAPEILVLGMDIGSSSLRTALFDERGQRIFKTSASREYAVRYTPDSGAELSPVLRRRGAANCLHETLNVYRAARSLKKRTVNVLARPQPTDFLADQSGWTTSVTSPGRQRIVTEIGRQQTVQSSISDCSPCEVSIWSANDSPQCGQMMSASTIKFIAGATLARRVSVNSARGFFRKLCSEGSFMLHEKTGCAGKARLTS